MWWWRWFTYIEHICWYVWLSVVAVWLAGRNCYVVIGGVGVLTLTLGVLVKNVVSSEPSVHYDLRPGVCWDILGPRWGFTRKFRVITEQSSWLLTQVTLTALSHLSSLYRCSSQGLLWSAGRRIWGWGSILLECPDSPVSPLSHSRSCWTLFNFLPARSHQEPPPCPGYDPRLMIWSSQSQSYQAQSQPGPGAPTMTRRAEQSTCH